jgi:single-strand DNA-binding protein
MINKVTLIGNTGKDPEVKMFDGEKGVLKITVATNESYKGKNGDWQNITEWHNVEYIGYVKSLESKLKKGMRVYVEGKISTDSWEDKEGNKRTATKIKARSIKILDRVESNDFPQGNTPAPSQGSFDDMPF